MQWLRSLFCDLWKHDPEHFTEKGSSYIRTRCKRCGKRYIAGYWYNPTYREPS